MPKYVYGLSDHNISFFRALEERFSNELNTFNSLPKEKRERLITKVLVDNERALKAFEQHIEIIEEVDKFHFDPEQILRMAKACNRI